MSDQIDMFPGKRGRGRPKGDRPALTGAQRMRRLREKAATVLYGGEVETGQTLADLSDTALIELVRAPIRDGYPVTVTEIMVELVKRADSRRSPHVDSVRLARWVNGGWYELTGQDESCHVTENPEIPTGHVDMDNGHVTENEATVDQGEAFTLAPILLELAMPVEPVEAVEAVESKPSRSSASKVDQGKGSRDYPAETKARALLLLDQGKTHAEILAMIRAELGYAPDSNPSKNLKRWRKDPRVVEILAKLETDPTSLNAIE